MAPLLRHLPSSSSLESSSPEPFPVIPLKWTVSFSSQCVLLGIHVYLFILFFYKHFVLVDTQEIFVDESQKSIRQQQRRLCPSTERTIINGCMRIFPNVSCSCVFLYSCLPKIQPLYRMIWNPLTLHLSCYKLTSHPDPTWPSLVISNSSFSIDLWLTCNIRRFHMDVVAPSSPQKTPPYSFLSITFFLSANHRV